MIIQRYSVPQELTNKHTKKSASAVKYNVTNAETHKLAATFALGIRVMQKFCIHYLNRLDKGCKKWLAPSLLIGIVVLSGCTDRVMLASDKMAEIRNSKSQPVEPVPKPILVDDYVYDASELRSPFMPPSLLSKQQVIDSNSGVTPDTTREKEALEAFELSQLVYRGRVISPEGVEFGLIQRPDGVVDSVKVGDYMGMNHGRIVEITATQINLIEIVPDNRAGYVEKPASVVSPI